MSTQIDLSGKTALVTGSSRGIGAGIARTLAGAGARVAVNYLEDAEGKNLAEARAVAGDCAGSIVVGCDVSDAAQCGKLAEAVKSAFGGLDILVNNAGLLRDRSMKKMTAEEFDSVIKVNLAGPFHVTRAFLEILRPGGKIVNMASVAGSLGFFGQANYASSKAGLMALTKVMARELARNQINVNAIAPGFIDTDMTKGMPEDVTRQFIAQIPLGRFGATADIANVALFLASDLARYITGQIIHVNGGFHMPAS